MDKGSKKNGKEKTENENSKPKGSDSASQTDSAEQQPTAQYPEYPQQMQQMPGPTGQPHGSNWNQRPPQYSPGQQQQQSQHQGPPPGYTSPLPHQNVLILMMYLSTVVYVQSVNSRRSQTTSLFSDRRNKESPPEFGKFTDVEVRRVFVRKVYLILMLQLLFTLGVITLFIFEPNTRNFVRQNSYIYYIALAVFIGVYIGLACSGEMRRKFPTNIILLSIFTVAAACMMGTLSSYFDNNSVIIAVGICAAVCFAVTLFSFHTKFDFTTCGGILCILLLILIIFGIISIFVQQKVMTLIYAALGSIVFMMYLAYDTQMLIGGKTVELNPEEYIFAAIQIYIDVVYIFMFLLVLVGGAHGD